MFDNFKEYIDGKMKASTVGLGIEFGPSIRAELTPSEKASGLSRVGASMSLPPLFSRSWSNTNDIDNIERHCGLKICKKSAIRFCNFWRVSNSKYCFCPSENEIIEKIMTIYNCH